MGRYAQARRRGCGAAQAPQCPDLTAPADLAATIAGGTVEVSYDDSPDTPLGWFILMQQGPTTDGPWTTRDSELVGAGPYGQELSRDNGEWIRVFTAHNADGTGCTSPVSKIHAT